METICYVKLLTICASIWCIPADKILVTKDQCGRSIELLPQNIVTLEYTGEDVGDTFSPCVIDFVNNVEDDMTCIRTNSSNSFNINCHLILEYYPQGYQGRLYDKVYRCSDFSSSPICERSSRASVVYTRSFFKNETFMVWLYTAKYICTTTSSPWSSWNSWSSWSSYSDSFDDKDDDDNNTGLVVALTVGIVAFVVIVILCAVGCQKKSEAPKPIYGPPVAVVFTPQNNQPQYPGAQPNTAASQNQYTPYPSQFPGYQVHAPVYQSVPNQSMPAGYQPNPSYSEPSDNSPSTTGTNSQEQQFSSIAAETAPTAPCLQPSDQPPSYESLKESDF